MDDRRRRTLSASGVALRGHVVHYARYRAGTQHRRKRNAALSSVRAALLKMQQDFSLNPVFADGTPANGAVYDGRDTGTVVCPQADIKFFIMASPEIRAMRRFKEMAAKGMDVTYEDVLKDVNHRDEMATNRKIAPLKPAADAHLLDT